MGVSLLLLWSPPLPWLRDGVVYVSPDGHDWSTGRDRGSAVASIQRAADLVAPGESVVILPGVYRETVRVRHGGEPGQPVTFRAAVPGTVTISGSVPDSMVRALRWRHEGGPVWSTDPGWPVYHVVVDGENLYHVRWGDARKPKGERSKVEVLRLVESRPGAYPAFAYERGRLWIGLPDGGSPSDREIEIHRPIAPPYASWTIRSANVRVEADHVVFEGLRFHLGVGAGLLLWSSRDVIVRDCAFSGSTHGVRAFPSVRVPDGLVVEHSLYDNYPQALWLEDGWLTWREVYRHHAFSTLVNVIAENVEVAHNLVAHGGDGVQVTTPGGASPGGVRIHDNLFFRGTDDAIQLDGYARNVSVARNLVYGWYVGLGLSPVLDGPVLAERNVFLEPPGGPPGAHLKFLNPWEGRPDARGGPIRHVAVVGNVFVGGVAAWANVPGVDVLVADNRFALERPRARWPKGTRLTGNRIDVLPSGYDEPGLDCAWIEALPEARVELPAAFAALREGPSPVGGGPVSPPGPRWYHYADRPATAGIERALSDELVRGRCG